MTASLSAKSGAELLFQAKKKTTEMERQGEAVKADLICTIESGESTPRLPVHCFCRPGRKQSNYH